MSTRLGLVLSRRTGQEIHLIVPGLAEPIVLTVARIEGHCCRIGILAPHDVLVRRPEAPEACSRRLVSQ